MSGLRLRFTAFLAIVIALALCVQHDARALSFAPPVNYAAPTQLSGMAMGDFNGDGNLDFVTANDTSDNISIFLGNADGTLQNAVNIAVSSRPVGVAVADFNGDHTADLAVTCYGSNEIKVFLGNGDGTFQAPLTLPAGTNPRSITTADFNRDGHLDIAVTNIMDNTVGIYLGNGDGTFQAPVTYNVGASQPGALAAYDLNGDGALDLVTTNYFGNNVSVLLGNGDGTFGAASHISVGVHPSSVAIKDLNGDGKGDLVVTNSNDGNISILLGNGDGTFQPQVLCSVGHNPSGIAFADFDGDGNTDIAVALYDDATIAILTGTGDGTFNAPVKYSVGSGSGAVFVADLNHDGNPDLIVGEQNVPAVSVLIQTKLFVTGMSITPGSTLASPPTVISVTLNAAPDPATVNTSSVQLVRAGADGQFGTADDVAIAPKSITLNGAAITLDLTGAKLPDDQYQLTLRSGAAPPTSGLAGYWKFDEGSGAIAADSSGNGNVGALRNGPAWTAGEVAGALQFNGSNQDVQVPNSSSLAFHGTALTLAAWIYPTSSANDGAIIHKELQYSILRHPTGAITYADSQTWSYGNIGSYGSTPLNTWSHVAVTFDGSSILFYVNGALVGTVPRPGTLTDNTNPLYVGSYNGNNSYFAGSLDEARVYNRALSAAEVAALAENGIEAGGAPLDGKFSGTFPSGDGSFANFVAGFSISTPKLQVISMTPAPNAVLNAPPASLVVGFSKSVDPATVTAATVQLVGAGPDGVFGTADDAVITPNSIAVAPDGSSATLDLTNVNMPSGAYQFSLGGLPALPGLAAWWKFDEASGASILDSSGQGVNGTLIGGATRVPGVRGGAVNFNGVDSYVNFGDAMNNLNVPLSVAAWVYRRGNVAVTVIASDDGTTYYGYWMHIYDDNTLEISYGDGTGAAFPSRRTKRSTATITNNTWTHISAVIRGPTDMSLYINGVDAGGTYSGSGGPMLHSADPLVVGHKTLGNTYIDAILDDMQVYSRGLSASEVAMLASQLPSHVADTNGNLLDGKYPGQLGGFPSGDGTFASFVAPFTITAPLQVTGLSVTPGATLNSPPASITATLNGYPDPLTVSAATVQLVRGPDGQLGTADDVVIVPNAVSVSGNSITLDLSGAALPNDQYQLTLQSGGSASSSGLVGHWTLDEGSGLTAHDSSGNGNDGILQNGPVWSAGIIGGGLSFDGIDDMVTVNPAPSLEPANGITVATWAKISSPCLNAICELVRKAAPFQSGYLLRWSDTNGIVQFVIDQNGTPLRVNDIQPNSNYLNAWHHFAGTFDASTGVATLYVDGVAQSSSTGLAAPLQHTGNLQFMNFVYAGSAATPGVLDEVRIYNRPLSALEVRALNAKAIADTSGNLLDGKYPGLSGGFPSGDGTFASFVATFTLAVPPLQVTSMTPAPGAVLSSSPASITVALSQNPDPATVDASTVQLIRAGPDGQLGTADDVAIVPNSVSVNGNAIVLDLTGINLPNDKYQVLLASATNVSAGLACYLKLDEGAGTTSSDATGNGNTATLYGGATWAAGISGSALSFDGASGYATFGATPGLNLAANSAFTFSGWVNTTDSYGPILTLRNSVNASSSIQIDVGYDGTVMNTNHLMTLIKDDSNRTFARVTGGIVNDGTWHHFACTRDASGTLELFLDGVSQGANQSPDSAGPITTDLRCLGSDRQWVASGGGLGNPIYQYLNGRVDEVRIYNRQLSAAEIAALASNASKRGITGASGALLDGKYPGLTGGFPSGDGTFANFVASVTLATPPLQVTGMSPAPNAILVAAPGAIVVDFSKNVDPATVTASTVRLTEAGPDGVLGTADDIVIQPVSLTVVGSQLSLDLTGVALPAGKYALILDASPGPGFALDTNGSTTFARIPAMGDTIPTSEITVEFWEFARTANYSATFGLDPDINGGANRCQTHAPFLSGNDVLWDFGDIAGAGRLQYNAPTSLLGSWQHLALVATQSGDAMKIYRNGILEASKSGSGIFQQGAFDLLFGRDAAGHWFNGQLDEFRIWNHERTQAEIQANMHRTLTGSEPGLIGYWNFDESGQTVLDKSSSHKSGSLGNDISIGAEDARRVVSTAPIYGGIMDLGGNPLDGKFPGASGGFPSGDGAFSDFVANFRIDNAPVASSQNLTTSWGTPLPVTLSASDADNDPLVYTIVTQPAHGTLSGVPPNVTYTSGAYAGPDGFSFKANDGVLDSNVATVSIAVTDFAPVALDGSAVVHSGGVTPIALTAVDAENNLLSWTLLSVPAHGNLFGTLPNLQYIADGYTGTDSFTFKVNDGLFDSNVATFIITIVDRPPSVSAGASPATIIEGQSVAFSSMASDPDGDALATAWDFGDGATGSGANPAHTYTAGVYTATVTVTDGGGLTASATVVIHVYRNSDRPTARILASALNGYVDRPVGFDASFSTDPKNDIVSYNWNFGDGSPQGSGQLIARAYTAAGTYTVTLTIADAQGLTDAVSMTMIVLPAGDEGKFTGSLRYAVNWNRSAKSSDAMTLDAILNVGDVKMTSITPLAMVIVGQTFKGSAGTKPSISHSVTGPVVMWQIKPGKKGSPAGTYELRASVKHAMLGADFAQAGAIGAKSAALKIPVTIQVGSEVFATPIDSQFRFGGNGARGSGGGQGF